jgi:hypothetical protein
VLRDHKLKLTNSRYDDADMTFLNADEVMNSNWWMYHLTVIRNSKNQVIAFDVNVRSVDHLRYFKQ